jgi:K+-sensing histidine kinase KdpD
LNEKNDWKGALTIIGTITFVFMFTAFFIFQDTNVSLLFILSVLTATYIYQTIFSQK